MSESYPKAGLDLATTIERPLRPPKAILWRALAGGMTAGGLLAALLVLPDSFKAQFAPEPDTASAVTWSALLIAVPVGALVGFMPALLGLVVWERQISNGARRARIAGSATAALTVAATAGVFALLTAAPGAEWTTSSLLAVAVVALVSFAIALNSRAVLCVPIITTTRRRRQESLR